MLVQVQEAALDGHHDLDLVILGDSILLQIMTEGNHLQVRVLVNQEAIQEAAASAVALPEVVVSVEQEVVGSAVPETVLLEAATSAQAEAALEAAVPAEKEEAIFQNLTLVTPKALFLIAQKVEHQASVPLAKLNAFYY